MDQLQQEAPSIAPKAPPVAIDADEPETVVDAGDGLETVETPDQSPPDDIEARARAQGWVPRDQFRGPPDQWRDASAFVARGEEEMPILRERLRDTTRKLSEIERDYQQRFERMERINAITLQRQREQLENAYLAAQRTAVESGDVDRWGQLEADKRAALRNHDESVAPPPPPQHTAPQANDLPPEVARTVDAWVQRNPWFNADQEMNAVATKAFGRIQAENPYGDLNDHLKETENYVRQRYADKFAAPKRTASVESGNRQASAQRGKGAASLPAEARSAGEKFVREGIFKDLNEYAKDYWSQDN